ncbi:Anti-sigma regulatory factor (Ser/Thr protein kinase) [Nonomuraea jiangxiensis]|uniref:Anti-sigma regulatory factor (Ser/Thr protein kinase) n=2 Tax=Nonomuraea jiangxiensis TaxID=633440 RepID=A0A1G9MPD6_9ACTN|nr:Anti-sigma regulatory factor (Ser/Thr protein kinase) [Nonomuraea jiangxiensis]
MVRSHARHGGLKGERLEDLVIAVNEAVTNVLDHGGGDGTVTVRVCPGVVTVEVTDVAGVLSADHLRSAQVDPTASHGFGLWVIQRLCDKVRLDQTGHGSRLSLSMCVSSAVHPG